MNVEAINGRKRLSVDVKVWDDDDWVGSRAPLWPVLLCILIRSMKYRFQ